MLSSAGSERRSRLRRDGGREETMHYVYILHSEKRQRYYIGSTWDLDHRLNQHNSSHKGFTSVGGPWKLVYSETCETKTEALKRERYLKRMKSTRFIEDLLNPEKNNMDA